jgi:uncharacterized protein (TIGR00296 family)
MVGEDITLEDGKALIKFARENIESYLKTGKRADVPDEIKEKYSNNLGVFVTLNKVKGDEHMLRGCIGYPEPIKPLIQAILDVSVFSATQDPRFPTVNIDEMDEIVIELTVLSVPELIDIKNKEEYLEKIKIGRDGLIIERGFYRGLLLPQVPVDDGRNWDIETFLSHTCLKAGIGPNAWKDKETKVLKFEGKIFEELTPRGEIRLKEL